MIKRAIGLALLLTLAACGTTEKSASDMKDKGTEMADKAATAADTATSTVMEPAKTATETMSSEMVTNCKMDKDTRTIEVLKSEAGGCELFYTKFGDKKSVASSGFGSQYCEEVKERIQSNLNKAGFTCE